jgi:hypothetical protein
MSRSGLVLALLLVGGCRTAADAEQIGSPGGSVAGTEAKAGKQSNQYTSTATAGSGTGLANALVAVTTITAGEAQPCERVCGSLGDCLFADDSYTAPIAGGLELECLDMCVHSPDNDRAKIDFLACASNTECGPLQACAEQSWTALAAARQSPDVSGIVASADPCKAGCRWYWACTQTGSPPGEAYLDPELDRQMNYCVDDCDNMQPDQRRMWVSFSECIPTHCAYDRIEDCFNHFW